jgi:hypothetical protein
MSTLIETKIYEDTQALARLGDLGLDVASLTEVVLRGEQARAEATPHDPINAAALDAYRYRVRAFRDFNVPRGWKPDHEGGVERTWSPDGLHVVITRAGDSGVGIRSACPQPKRKPGSEIQGLVEGGMLLLDPNWMNRGPKSVESEKFATWILLVYRVADLVRSELSSPTGFTEDDDVLGWYERIILPSIDLASATTRNATHLEEPDVIDVPVIRKR